MDSEEILLITIICGAASLLLFNERRWWVRPWLIPKDKGNLHLVNEELESDPDAFKNFLRMDKVTFENLLARVAPRIKKHSTKFRDPITAKNRLIITLRYLATGESMTSLHYSFRIGISTISNIIPEVCTAIYETLKDDFLKVPNSAAKWLQIAEEFEEKWQFPNAIGAIDGKHICFQAPVSAGSTFHNYKGTESIVLLALVDANYNFLYVDVGANGRVSDGGVFQKSSLYKAMRQNTLNFPQERPLPGFNTPMPYVVIGDSAFPLAKNILKPYPMRNIGRDSRVFNYRLSRARRVVENAFGILANRWRILLTTINLSADKVRSVTLACVALHNFLKEKCPTTYSGNCETEDIDQTYSVLYSMSQQQGNRAGALAIQNREKFKIYFNTVGAVSWQNNLS